MFVVSAIPVKMIRRPACCLTRQFRRWIEPLCVQACQTLVSALTAIGAFSIKTQGHVMTKTTARRRYITLAAAISALLLSSEVLAMRCGNKLITKGDTQAKVLKYCGEPAQKTQRLGLRSGVYRGDSSYLGLGTDGNFSRGYYYPYGHSEVLLEDWVFNFGPYQLMRRVTFADGFVEDIETLKYGYRE